MDTLLKTLRITEIFYSLQGESATSGLPTTFIRLTGCPLRCQYCDSAYAFSGGEKMTLKAILETVERYPAKHITVTGGEPLAQPDALALMTLLSDQGYFVSIETSGALDISKVDSRVMVVMDLKTPDSKESHRNLLENLDHIKKSDNIKFVICSQGDFDWSIEMVKKHDLLQKADIYFSPSFDEVNPTELAEWLMKAGLPIRLQMQLHKSLWGDEPGR